LFGHIVATLRQSRCDSDDQGTITHKEKMVMFGGKQRHEAAQAQLEQELGRLRSLTPQQIGAELISMVEPCGLDPDAIPVGALAKCLAPDNGRLRGPDVEEFWRLVDEGAQALVRAGLFTSLGWGGTGDGNVFGLSRAGREALDHGTVEAVLSDDTAAT
jgi:hypothetical protein